MITLIVDTRFRGQSTSLCAVSAAFGDGPLVPPDHGVIEAQFTMPPGTSMFRIEVQSLTPEAFSTTGRFTRDATGAWTVDPAGQADFDPPVTMAFGGGVTMEVTAHLAALRDASARSVASLEPVPAFRTAFAPQPPVTEWSPAPDLGAGSVVDTPCVVGNQLQHHQQDHTAPGELVVLERTGTAAPLRVAVHWPASVPRDAGAGPTPFLFYFHHGVTQAAEAVPGDPTTPRFVHPSDHHDPVTNSTYPDGFDYQLFGLWRYFHYDGRINASTGLWAGDPLRRVPEWRGIPYQIEASGKPVVAVVALNKVVVGATADPCDELAAVRSAGALQELLRDIQRAMFRRAGSTEAPPPLGRLAMAAFSSGHSNLSCFLNDPANRTHPLVTETLRELYLFDPHADDASMVLPHVSAALAWAAAGTDPTTKIARLYTQIPPPALQTVLAPFGLSAAATPFDLSVPPDGRRSVTCLPLAMWNGISPSTYTNTQKSHQVIPSVMLTDALRRSGF